MSGLRYTEYFFGCEDQMNNLFDQAVKDAGDDAVSQAKVQTEK